MTVAQWRTVAGGYVDSVRLMQVTRRVRELDGVTWVTAVMGTAANLAELRDAGVADGGLAEVGPDQLVVAVMAHTAEEAERALDEAVAAVKADDRGGQAAGGPAGAPPARTQAEATAQLSDAGLTLVSVPGDYAALEAHKALTAGRHVLVFSDHVALADEVALKQRGAANGLLVMGPDAGTAAISGVGLGFANAVARGPVGVVAAAGTGAQEIMSLVGQWGSGVSHVLGLGGRDLSREVGALSARQAIAHLRADAGTEVVVVVSKPPSRQVAERVLADLAGLSAVVAFLGLADADHLAVPEGVAVADTLEGAALAAVEAAGHPRPNLTADMAEAAVAAADGLGAHRRALRGLFTGGTLCYETMVLASRRLGAVHSNAPLRDEWAAPAPEGAHVCLDLGEDEYTRGRPHPMIDPEARLEHIDAAGDDAHTAVVLLDVVLGHGAHGDPAGVVAPACEQLTGGDDSPAVVASVLGTDDDPQHRAAQRERLRQAGCWVAPTAARAALLATAIAERRPETAVEPA
jgi:FdrA protein